MIPFRLCSLGLLAAAVLTLCGCAAFSPDATPVSRSSKSKLHGSRPPRGYLPLKVRNSCFVESVNFCDFYRSKQLGGPDGWAQVLQWGNQSDDFTVKGGHAVAIFAQHEKINVYDINFGVIPLKTPLARKLELDAVTPEIFAGYPNTKAVLARYMDDVPPHPEEQPKDYSSAATTDELHDAFTVARRFAPVRPVRVVEFIRREEAIIRPYAITVFTLGNKLCLYSPSAGTRVVTPPLADVDDLNLIKTVVQESFPGAENVQWFNPVVPSKL